MKIVSHIVGCGSYLPERVVTNEELARTVDTSDAWIVERTGIRERHMAAPGELTSDLAHHAAHAALARAGIAGADVDLVIVATTTPDQTFPATATRVQAMLGLRNGAAFDIQAVCSGFIYALAVGDNFIKAGQAETVVVIGAETFTRILDWTDRSTCVLFGDGAGAVVLRAHRTNGEAHGEPGHNAPERGILSTHLHSDGRLNDLLYVDGGPSSTGTVGKVRMSGREVFRSAVNNLAAVLEEGLAANGLKPSDVDWVVPHQANLRIIEGTARKLGLSTDKVILTVDRHANTSAASIPLALDVAVSDGRIRTGHLVVMEALGGGLTWGAGVVRW
jgi:3-oxoacyl-[acyl-carrier-protein] synthase-3